VQGRRARVELEARLRAGGALPLRAVVYDVAVVPWSADLAFDAVLLASPSAVDALPAALAQRAALVALGPTTATAVQERGYDCRVAAEPSVAGALSALVALEPPALAAPTAERELGA